MSDTEQAPPGGDTEQASPGGDAWIAWQASDACTQVLSELGLALETLASCAFSGGMAASDARQRIAGLEAEVDALRQQLGLPIRYGGEVG